MSDDKLRAAAERLVNLHETGWTTDSEQAAWAGLRVALAASATDEPKCIGKSEDRWLCETHPGGMFSGQYSGGGRCSLAASAPDEGPLPTAADLRGLAPGMTDGLSSEEYVRSIRDARPAVPALDVERLAEALDADWSPAWREVPVIGPNGVEFTEARWDKRALAEIVAREYAALQEQPE